MPESVAEERVTETAWRGEIADLLDLPFDDRGVRAGLIRALMFGGPQEERLTTLGVRIVGARILGRLDLASLGSPDAAAPPLMLTQCENLDLSLTDANLAGLDLSNSSLSALHGNHLSLGSSLNLSGVVLSGGAVITLRGARVSGHAKLDNLRRDPSVPGRRPRVFLSTARIDGTLSLRHVGLSYLDVAMATIRGQLDLQGALVAAGRGQTALFGDGVTISGDLLLTDRVGIIGETRLLGARIAGNLEIRHGAGLLNRGGDALSCDEARIAGSVFLLDGIRIDGGVRLQAARIGGQLAVRNGARLRHAGQDALCCDRATIGAGIVMGWRDEPPEDSRDASIEGTVRMDGTRVDASITIGRKFTISEKNVVQEAFAFGGEGLSTGGWVRFSGCTIEGRVLLTRAQIAGNLDITSKAQLLNRGGDALSCNGATVGGSVSLVDHVRVEGAARFQAARVGGELIVQNGARLTHPGKTALWFDRATISAGIVMGWRDKPAKQSAAACIEGTALFDGARVDGPITVGHEFTITSPDRLGRALSGEGLSVGGSVVLSGSRIEGEVRLTRAHIGGAMRLTDARLTPRISSAAPRQLQDESILCLEGARVGTALEVAQLDEATRGVIDLRGCHVGNLADAGGQGWGGRTVHRQEPTLDNVGRLRGVMLRLDGLTYDRLDDFSSVPRGDKRATMDARRARYVGFLLRQFPGPEPEPHHYAPQPYEQVAKTLRLAGRPEVSDWFARKKCVMRTRCRVDGSLVRVVHALHNLCFGHLYQPHKAFLTLFAAIIFGVALLFVANGTGAYVEKRTYVDLRPGTMVQLEQRAAPGGADDLKPSRKACWAADSFHGARVVAWLRLDQGPITRFLLRVAEASTFAFDLLLPLVDLKLDQRCEVDTDRDEHRFWATILSVYSGLGLLLIPLFIATISGLAKRD